MASVLQAELEFTADEREQWKYEQREKFLHDEATRRYEAKVALEKAVKEGTAQGIAQGMAQGVLKGKLEAAHAMKQDKLPIELIMKYTGLSAEQIANA